MENLNIKIDKIEGNELVVRQGDALPAMEPVKINLKGDIKTVSTYLKGRLSVTNSQKADSSTAIITVDAKAMEIKLMLDPVDPYGGEITGKLELSEELVVFGINGTQTMTRETFVKLLRFNRLRFFDLGKHEEILKAVQAFSFKAEVTSAASADTRGNKQNSFDKKVHSDIPNEFTLKVPVFKGQEAKKFRVEICLDTTEGSARFWLESVELAELIEIEREAIFQEELKECAGFVIIRK